MRERREAFFLHAQAFTPYVAVERGDALFFIPTVEGEWQRGLFVRRRRNDMKTLAKTVGRLAAFGVTLPHDPVIIDVGANIGTTTVMALRRHGFASAVAIEPSAQTFSTLRLNLAANNLDGSVHAICAAASDRPGRVILALDAESSGSNRVKPPTSVHAHAVAETVEVDAITLDSVVAEGIIDPGRAGLLWIDAQGHEPAVIRGAARLIKAGVPLVTATRPELPGWEQTAAALAEVLGPHYTDAIELRRSTELRPIGEFPALLESITHSTDVLLIRSERASTSSD
ncbi:MAG: FkbM family methyltransferase [Actinomycetota bacterium]|nr:FkbM family methyltransferase [Actinomycetota bacterium]